MMKHKTFFYSIILILFSLIVILYAMMNSPRVVKIFAEKFAPGYHISYQNITGDLLNGLNIEGLTYKKKPICQDLTFRWNPAALFYKNLSVSKLICREANYQNIKTMYNDLAFNDENDTDKQKTFFSFLIPQRVNIAQFTVTFTPLQLESLAVKKFHFEVKDIDILLDRLMIKSGKLKVQGESNLADIRYEGLITNNHIKGTLGITALDKLIRAYGLPIREGAIKKIVLETEVSPDEVKTSMSLAARSLLNETLTKGKLNVDIQSLVSKAVYEIKTDTLKVESSMVCTTPYAKDINVSNDLMKKDSQIVYKGQLNVGEWAAMDQNITDPLDHMHITYKGNMQNLQADITAKNLTGTVTSDDLMRFDIHIGSIREIMLSRMMQLPKDLEDTKFTFDITMPWIRDENLTQQADVRVRSNIADVDANVTFDKEWKMHAESRLPEASLLKSVNKKVNWDVLGQISLDAEMSEDNVTAHLATKTKAVVLNTRYGIDDHNLSGEIDINGVQANIRGTTDKNIILSSHISSFEAMFKALEGLYHFEVLPALSGSADVSAKIEAFKTLELALESPLITYKADTKTTHTIKSLKLSAHIENEKISFNDYSMRYDDLNLFATTPSVIRYDNNVVHIEPFWINDSMKVEGSYDLNTTKGVFTAKAKKFPIKHPYADMNIEEDITVAFDGNATSVNGTVVILEGKILYDLMQKSFPSDSDILIVQEQKTQKKDTFMDNLSVNILVKSQKSLVYQKPPVDLRIKMEGNIYKTIDSPLLVLGMVTFPKGGSHNFQNKKFILNDSYIYFSGDINNPLLELSARYDAQRYLIKIDVKGTAGSPNIRFSSIPSLSKEQILSVILFDAPGAAGSYSSNDMMKMMGGVMAKSVLSQFGLNIDLLRVREDSSIEIGKKLNENTTVFYINDKTPQMELRYKHNDHLESVLGTSAQSSSYDIFYKKDY